MFDFHERRRLQGILYSRAFLSLLTLVVLFFVYVAWNAYTTAAIAQGRRMELAGELARLTERREQLEGELASLNDPRGMEAELRKRYEVGREGEELIVLVDEAPTAHPQPVTHEDETWWEAVTGWF
jgi:cell division protein FtsB